MNLDETKRNLHFNIQNFNLITNLEDVKSFEFFLSNTTLLKISFHNFSFLNIFLTDNGWDGLETQVYGK